MLFHWIPPLIFSVLGVAAELSSLKDCNCERILRPVCATDGRTFGNSCEFDCARRRNAALGLAYAGACCPAAQLCPPSYSPVCDNFGTTHDNECLLEHRRCVAKRMYGVQLRVTAHGKCDSASGDGGRRPTALATRNPCDFECGNELDPVCDSRGVTHRSRCLLEQTNCALELRHQPTMTYKHTGPCQKAALGAPTREFGSAESHSSDDPFFGNPYEPMERLEVKVNISERRCNPSEFDCPTKWDPVCDSASRLHRNRCFFDAHLCRLRQMGALRNLPEVASRGVCGQPPTTVAANSDGSGRAGSDGGGPDLGPDGFGRSPIGSDGFSRAGLGAEGFGRAPSASDGFPRGSLVSDGFPKAADGATKPPASDGFTRFSESLSRGSPESQLRASEALPRVAAFEGFPRALSSADPPSRPSDAFSRSAAASEAFQRSSTAAEPLPKATDAATRLPTTVAGLRSLKLAQHDPTGCRVCDPARESPDGTVPVCDNRNQTHESACALANWNCGQRSRGAEERVLVHVGPCRATSVLFTLEKEICPVSCPKHLKPVCDSDGITHPNLCTFQMLNCRNRKLNKMDSSWIVTLHECPQPPAEPQLVGGKSPAGESRARDEEFNCPDPVCTQIPNPVCDNEGTIHKNECLFAWARCLAARSGRTLRAVPDEECSANRCRLMESKVCGNEYDPVCGSDFRTHPNHCFFEKAQCQDEELDVLFKGECELCLRTPCPILDPSKDSETAFLCDQNGETKSRCEFEMVRCVYEIKLGYNITAAYEGKCCQSPENCSLTNEPVCDSRGRTHRNRCHFDVANCRIQKIEHGEGLKVRNNGSCEDSSEYRKTAKKDTLSITAAPLTTPSRCNETLRSCNDAYDPICGSNHITYANECHFYTRTCNQTDSISILHRGPCCTDDCPDEFSPVCDSIDKTHLNWCEFGRQRCLYGNIHGVNLTVKSYGPCETDSCNFKCSPTFNPICGSNGKTYSSECELKKVNCLLRKNQAEEIAVDYDQECCPKRDCGDVFEPVCDVDRKTHPNACAFELARCRRERRNSTNLELAYTGSCCGSDCSGAKLAPVCDGSITHRSHCHFKVAQCDAERRGGSLSLAYEGECCALPTGQCERSGRVCDSDGETHSNRCRFEWKKCVDSHLEPEKPLSIMYNGDCCRPERCELKPVPVCDNNGTTHVNLCHFRNAKCVYDKMNITAIPLMVAYEGECCGNECSDKLDPVCDSRGEIHRNMCRFELRQCEAERRKEPKPTMEPLCTPQQLKTLVAR